MNRLTSDNSQLSRPKNEPENSDIGSTPAIGEECRALKCTNANVEKFVYDSVAPNTRRAYESDLKRFEAWDGSLPASDELIASYLAEHADDYEPSTLIRWVSSLGKAHRLLGRDDPTKGELVRSVLKGVRRTHQGASGQAKPLMRDDLFPVLDCLGRRPKDVRDRALLLVGFAGGFRRSELVGLNYADVRYVRQGAILRIGRSKTDQFGEGREIGIPHGRGRHCPVEALEAWQTLLEADEGAIFRPVTRHGKISSQRLSGEAVSLIIRQRLEESGIEADGYSAHSLRSGFATSAAVAGVASWKIRQQTGHRSEATLARYIRRGELFLNNPVSSIL